MKRKRRIACLLLCMAVFLTFRFLCISVSAEQSSMPEGYENIPERLPEDVQQLLPDGAASQDAEAVGEAVGVMANAEYWLSLILEWTGIELGSALRLLAKLCGLLILSAIFGTLQSSLGSDALAGAVRFCSTTAIFAAIIYTQLEHLQSVTLYFERLSSLMGAMIPVAGTVWAMGGNVTTASAGTGGMYLFLTVCENLCAGSVMPICCFSTALALCNTLSPEIGLRGFAGTVKKIYTFVLGMVMTVLVSSLGAQTALSAAADSTTARAAKMVSASVIPVVGGSVGDTLRTVASGVQYLKNVVGIGGIFFLLLLLLPTLLSLLMTRLAFLLASGIADLLGCEQEGRLMGELGNVYGCMIAVVSMTSVMFILALWIFVRTVVAAL